ncbi:hypothetical protein HDV63DRAFT_377691 [Trichoderma sp. SZMC 28014]
MAHIALCFFKFFPVIVCMMIVFKIREIKNVHFLCCSGLSWAPTRYSLSAYVRVLFLATQGITIINAYGRSLNGAQKMWTVR